MAFCTKLWRAESDNAQYCTAVDRPCGLHWQRRLDNYRRVRARRLASCAYATAGPPLPPGATYALWADRVVGYVIDLVLVGVGMGVLYLVLGGLFAMMAGLGSQPRGRHVLHDDPAVPGVQFTRGSFSTVCTCGATRRLDWPGRDET